MFEKKPLQVRKKIMFEKYFYISKNKNLFTISFQFDWKMFLATHIIYILVTLIARSHSLCSIDQSLGSPSTLKADFKPTLTEIFKTVTELCRSSLKKNIFIARTQWRHNMVSFYVIMVLRLVGRFFIHKIRFATSVNVYANKFAFKVIFLM